jgi:hypothetical protein
MLIQIRPLNGIAIAEELPMAALRICGMGQAWVPMQRHG